MTKPKVSVLVVSWNTRAQTLVCLASLHEAAGEGLPYETIVVDNGSRDGSAEALESTKDITLIRNERNVGFAAAVNQAFAASRAELVLLLNSDVRLAPGCLSALVRFLQSHEQAAGVAPAYRHPEGTAHGYARLPTLSVALAIATGLRRLPPFARRMREHLMVDEDFSRPRPVPQPAASCLLLRRSCLSDGRVLHEKYPIFFNDVDLARCLAARGKTLWMTPDAVADHSGGASTSQLPPQMLTRHHLGGLVKYLGAQASWLGLAAFRAAVLADWVVRRVAGRQAPLSFRLLLRALTGDVGPLPGGDQRTWLIYLSAVPWRGTPHRQHELARQLARGYRVLFVEPPRLAPSVRSSVEQVASGLWRMRSRAPLPLGRFLPPVNRLNRRFAARQLRSWLDERPARRLLWIDEDLAEPLAGRLGEDARIYDAADLDWTFTRRWNRPHLRRSLARAVRCADLLFVSSSALRAALPIGGPRPVELPNACDPVHFHPDGPESPALTGIPRPRLGYVGSIDERALDADLVAAVAASRPDWSFVLAGPAVATVRARLAALGNVWVMDPVPYEDVPPLLRGFDVCLIPYRAEGLVRYVHPKKFYEYVAMGKPVVATPLPSLAKSDAVRVAAKPEEFVVAIEDALTESTTPARSARRRALAEANSWDARGVELRSLLKTLDGRTA